MSKIVDLDQNEAVGDDEQFIDVSEDSVGELSFEEPEEREEAPKPELPEKFRGKSSEEIASAYTQLEKELGRKGNEIGELRKLTDQLLELEIQQKKNQAQQSQIKEDDLSVDDWFEAPDRATEKYLERSPLKKELDEVKERLASQDREKARAAFEQKHTDFGDVVRAPEFRDWVSGSKYRLQLAQQADQYDYEAADELISLYKEIHGSPAGNESQEVTKRVESDRKKASLESSSKAGGTKKVFRRADLIKLKMNDPERYMMMQDEIMQAYAEKRVR